MANASAAFMGISPEGESGGPITNPFGNTARAAPKSQDHRGNLGPQFPQAKGGTGEGAAAGEVIDVGLAGEGAAGAGALGELGPALMELAPLALL